MPRIARVAPGGLVFHVFNRSVGRVTLFRHQRDYQAFERVMLEAHRRFPIRILSYCIMPNHWHFVPWPQRDGQVTDFFRWLTHAHAMRWRVSHHTVGYGPLYQGRFKCLPVQEDPHLLTLCRYVERNPLMAGLVRRAQDWPWSSLWMRLNGSSEMKELLSDWPVQRPRHWIELVNQPLSDRELERIRLSLKRGRPYGSDEWVRRTARRLGLQHTMRPRGRPGAPAQGT
jgi:putative transposase